MTVWRLHDSNLSGWNLLWAFVPLIGPLLLIYYYARPGTAGANGFGPDPLEAPAAALAWQAG